MQDLSPHFYDPDLAVPRSSQMRELAPGIYRIEGFFPNQVQAIQTTRQGGVSKPPYAGLNFGLHVGDDPQAVLRNRALLAEVSRADLLWLDQVHGTRVLAHSDRQTLLKDCRADAVFTDRSGRGCLVMTADCLPVLIARPAQQQVAAVHAGWRGLCDGVIEATLDVLAEKSLPTVGQDEWWIWLGPAIGPGVFEVGPEVRAAFLGRDARSDPGFTPNPGAPGKWLANLHFLARLRIQSWFETFRCRRSDDRSDAAGVVLHVAQQNECVFSMPERYFSYRRDHVTGRMASLISLI